MRRESSTSVGVFYPKFDKEKLIRMISQKLSELRKKLPLVLVVLFGSYAKGNYTAGSDVNLLVVYKGERRDDAFSLLKKELSIPRLEPHVYTEDEYRQMEETLAKMIAGGIILFPGNEVQGGNNVS